MEVSKKEQRRRRRREEEGGRRPNDEELPATAQGEKGAGEAGQEHNNEQRRGGVSKIDSASIDSPFLLRSFVRSMLHFFSFSNSPLLSSLGAWRNGMEPALRSSPCVSASPSLTCSGRLCGCCCCAGVGEQRRSGRGEGQREKEEKGEEGRGASRRSRTPQLAQQQQLLHIEAKGQDTEGEDRCSRSDRGASAPQGSSAMPSAAQ